MPSHGNCDLHTFSVRGMRLAVNAVTGRAYCLDSATVDDLTNALSGRGNNGQLRTSLGLAEGRGAAVRGIRGGYQPITWRQAYVGLHASVFCNMACRYCQADGHRRTAVPPAMSLEAAQGAMDFAVLEYATEAPSISFAYAISGEPLLAWDLFLALHDHGRQLAEDTGKAITWGVNTNGLALDDTVVADLAERDDVVLAISIDGPDEAHDAMRRTPGGRATYEDVVRSAERVLGSGVAHLERTSALATLTAAFPHPHCVLEHLLELGFRRAAIKVVRTEPEAEFGVNPETLPALQGGYSRLAQFLFSDLTEGTGAAFNALLPADAFRATINRVLSGVPFIRPCPAAREMVAIGPSGDIYPCDATVGCAEVRLGHVDEGIDGQARDRLAQLSVYEREPCGECWARLICGGECHHNALLHGDLVATNEAFCELRRHAIEEAIWLCQTVKQNCPETFQNLTEVARVPSPPSEALHEL